MQRSCQCQPSRLVTSPLEVPRLHWLFCLSSRSIRASPILSLMVSSMRALHACAPCVRHRSAYPRVHRAPMAHTRAAGGAGRRQEAHQSHAPYPKQQHTPPCLLVEASLLITQSAQSCCVWNSHGGSKEHY